MAISTAAAIIGGSILSGVLGARSASKASKATQASEQAGISEQRREFDITQQQSAPFREAGVRALEKQEILLGLRGTEQQQEAFNTFADSPGQRFLQDRARKNLARSASAIGGLGGGNVRTALIEQGVGFAAQDLQNEIARLGQVAGQGQAITQTLGQQRGNTASNIQLGLQRSGQARASGIRSRNEALQAGISGVATGLARGGAFSQPETGFDLGSQASNIDPFARAA